MNKKIGAGMISTVITLILGVVGLVAYLVNAGTAYFSNLGKNPIVICSLVIAILALCAFIVLGKESPAWTDILPVIAPACLIIGGITLLNTRINGIAAIMTFTNNAQTMSDLSSAVIAIASNIIGGIVGIVNAFLEVRKGA